MLTKDQAMRAAMVVEAAASDWSMNAETAMERADLEALAEIARRLRLLPVRLAILREAGAASEAKCAALAQRNLDLLSAAAIDQDERNRLSDAVEERDATIARWKEWHRDLARALNLDVVERATTLQAAARFRSIAEDGSTVRAAVEDRDRAIDYVGAVRAFHEAFGVPIESAPTMATKERRDLRRALILEEAIEINEAIERGDIVETADGIADLIYVAIGAALEFGIPLDRVWSEVHRSNMQKVGGSTREDGKILKPPGWAPPDIAGALRVVIEQSKGGE